MWTFDFKDEIFSIVSIFLQQVSEFHYYGERRGGRLCVYIIQRLSILAALLCSNDYFDLSLKTGWMACPHTHTHPPPSHKLLKHQVYCLHHPSASSYFQSKLTSHKYIFILFYPTISSIQMSMILSVYFLLINFKQDKNVYIYIYAASHGSHARCLGFWQGCFVYFFQNLP